MSKIIIVAGGTGFIGSHLCRLLSKENKVICIDNVTTGNKRNIERLLSQRNFIFIPGDICSSELFTRFKNQQIDQIYHLASPASVDYVVKYPTRAALTNSVGTKNLLDLANLKKARILFASSSEVYGDPQIHPQKEDYWGNVNPIGVRSGYDEGKRFGEALCMSYLREFGVSVGIARIFNTYGPNSSEKDTRVIPQFIRQALRHEEITVHGDGSQTRSFCYVGDTVLGLKKVMQSSLSGPFNIGNPDEYKIRDIAKIILDLTGSESKIRFTKRPIDDPSRRMPNISVARKQLNWSPHISLQKGLGVTINYFKKLLRSQNYG